MSEVYHQCYISPLTKVLHHIKVDSGFLTLPNCVLLKQMYSFTQQKFLNNYCVLNIAKDDKNKVLTKADKNSALLGHIFYWG